MGVKITGVGSYIPQHVEKNESFMENTFLNTDGSKINYSTDVIIDKFKAITGIAERRYAKTHQTASDLGFLAAEKAIEDAGIDPETLDYIIVAHNFGDVRSDSVQSDILPSLASRIKHSLGIKNPSCVGYDILFGCPGWVEGVIQANAYIKSGIAKRCLVIGAETLSRVVDKYDRDSMIYSDGAGATIIEGTAEEGGILTHKTATFAADEAYYLFSGKSYAEPENDTRYIKMHGRKIYNFALTNVPLAMKECVDESGVSIDRIKKIFIHQANEKMDEAIVARFYKLYDKPMPDHIMPMSISKLGNSSVATIPTLYDLYLQGEIQQDNLNPGDVIIFASVGAGMNINAMVYKY
ncbi:ketoacyl-ACP synthase III [Gangjinia marincola]|uniref:Ketoacyl-ACP synthase III n=1 Tax=Gangjinia marincola TaxID=578463 RepID=A0ABN1MK64_9FLAO